MSIRIAILGASRGLGAGLVGTSPSGVKLFLSSREVQLHETHSTLTCDFSKPEEQSRLFAHLKDFDPHRIFYVAGGGPHGAFAQKDWKDHQWALEVSLLMPMRLVHFVLQNLNSFQQIVLVGSAIAEDKADPGAVSYSVAKHGLLGLWRNLSVELPDKDLRLFSPGYMDTMMLPPNSAPRKSGVSLHSVQDVARALWDWSEHGDPGSHYVFKGEKNHGE